MAVILIGLPSSGKSTLGVLLAKALGFRFIDSDLVIQEKEKALLEELIEKKGREGFLRLENEINSRLDGGDVVISTGGSAVFGDKAMEHFKSIGTVVYLKISYETLIKRLGDYTHRGVVMEEGETLLDLYKKRVPLYEKWADITVESEKEMHESVKELAVLLGKRQ